MGCWDNIHVRDVMENSIIGAETCAEAVFDILSEQQRIAMLVYFFFSFSGRPKKEDNNVVMESLEKTK